nr:MAG TPA: hypothetical protein [Caudoviricetes sp.]
MRLADVCCLYKLIKTWEIIGSILVLAIAEVRVLHFPPLYLQARI